MAKVDNVSCSPYKWCMALNIEIEQLVIERWPCELIEVIDQFKQQMEDRNKTSVGSIEVMGWIKSDIDPLIADFNLLQYFDLSRSPSWQDIERVGRHIQTISDDRLVNHVGRLLAELPLWAKDAERNNGRRRHKKENIHCELCWRFSVNNERFCFAHHSKKQNTAHIQARRHVNKFRDSLQLVIESDRCNQAKYQWGEILEPENVNNLIEWLCQHRPLLSLELCIRDQSFESISALSRYLLFELDSDKEEKNNVKLSPRQELHEEVINNPDQLYGLLIRKEAYLRIHD